MLYVKRRDTATFKNNIEYAETYLLILSYKDWKITYLFYEKNGFTKSI